MLQLIIIDDNPIILKALEMRIPYRKLGLELAGAYQSAQDALANLRPDRAYVVLTDIAMPDMDGLDFIEIAQKRSPLCVFICITGYDKIEYMHRAIECQVISFLNKPLDDDKLRRALEKACDAVRRKMEYNTLLSSNRIQRNSETILKLLEGRTDELLYDELRITGGVQREVSLRVIAGDSERRAVDAIPADCTPDELRGMYPIHNLLFSMNDAAVSRELDVPCLVCVRRTASDDLLGDVTGLVLDAHEVVCGRRPGTVALSGAAPEVALSQVKLLIQMRRPDDAAECAVTAIEKMLDEGRTADELGAYIHMLERVLDNNEKNLNGLRYPMLMFGSLTELRRWVSENAVRACPQENDAATALYQYIHENVTAALSLQALSRVVHMHPNYIGKLIKDRYGTSFNDLLNKLRIELSVELLRADPEANLSVLAERVGYSDPKYFSRVFKLRTGLTPSAYARKLRS